MAERKARAILVGGRLRDRRAPRAPAGRWSGCRRRVAHRPPPRRRARRRRRPRPSGRAPRTRPAPRSRRVSGTERPRELPDRRTRHPAQQSPAQRARRAAAGRSFAAARASPAKPDAGARQPALDQRAGRVDEVLAGAPQRGAVAATEALQREALEAGDQKTAIPSSSRGGDLDVEPAQQLAQDRAVALLHLEHDPADLRLDDRLRGEVEVDALKPWSRSITRQTPSASRLDQLARRARLRRPRRGPRR